MRELCLHNQRGEKQVLMKKDILLTARCNTRFPLSLADVQKQLRGLRSGSEGLHSEHGSAEYRHLFTSL